MCKMPMEKTNLAAISYRYMQQWSQAGLGRGKVDLMQLLYSLNKCLGVLCSWISGVACTSTCMSVPAGLITLVLLVGTLSRTMERILVGGRILLRMRCPGRPKILPRSTSTFAQLTPFYRQNESSGVPKSRLLHVESLVRCDLGSPRVSR